MASLRRNWWKIVIVAFVFSAFYAVIHGMLPSDNNSALPPSIIAQAGMLPVAFILYGALWFGLLGIIFNIIQNKLPGTKVLKGITFGLFFCLLAFMLYFEPLSTASPFWVNMAWMLGDGVPLILFGVLLGLFVVPKTTSAPDPQSSEAK